MDVLGGFASVINLVQMSEKLFDLCREYFLEVRDPMYWLKLPTAPNSLFSDCSLKQCRSKIGGTDLQSWSFNKGKDKMRRFGLN